MGSYNPVEDMASAVYTALAKDLSDIVYDGYNTARQRKDGVMVAKTRRPTLRDVSVYQFPQSWGSTALGFDGIGGAAITNAQTTVVIQNMEAAVYFAGELAYVVPRFNTVFWEDLRQHRLASVDASKKYWT